MGNVLTDQNKEITAISYNHLNLPVEVEIADGTIKYTYDATGTRLSKKVESTADGTVITDYLGGFQYEDNDLQFFFQPEGYVKKENNQYIYHFIYKDHLGNNRLTYADLNGDGEVTPTEIIEENNYYPFGLKHQGYNELATDAHQYKFLDREYQPELGLNTIATDYRHYDPAIGRFNVMDAMSELAPGQTPYRYGFNNPVYWTDPSGLFESKLAAKAFAIEELGLSDGQYRIDPYTDGGYVILVTDGEFKGTVFYEYGELLPDLDIDLRSGGGGSSSGGSGSSSGSKPGFWNRFYINSGFKRGMDWFKKPHDLTGGFGSFKIFGNGGGITGGENDIEGRHISVDAEDVSVFGGGGAKSGMHLMEFIRYLIGGYSAGSNAGSALNATFGNDSKSSTILGTRQKSSIEVQQEKIIELQMRNFMYDRSTNKVVPRTHYIEKVYESQVPDYIKMMEQDSMSKIPNR